MQNRNLGNRLCVTYLDNGTLAHSKLSRNAHAMGRGGGGTHREVHIYRELMIPKWALHNIHKQYYSSMF